MTRKTSERRGWGWVAHYAYATGASWDARLGFITLGLSLPYLVTAIPDSERVPMLLAVTVGVCAGILGIVLTAMAVVTAFMTRAFVAIIGDLREALMPFATVAVVAAFGIIASIVGLAAARSAWPWVIAALAALALSATVWATVGTVQLVLLTIFFAEVRAKEISTLIEAEQLRAQRLREAR